MCDGFFLSSLSLSVIALSPFISLSNGLWLLISMGWIASTLFSREERTRTHTHTHTHTHIVRRVVWQMRFICVQVLTCGHTSPLTHTSRLVGAPPLDYRARGRRAVKHGMGCTEGAAQLEEAPLCVVFSSREVDDKVGARSTPTPAQLVAALLLSLSSGLLVCGVALSVLSC
jgi:hypothetical protein